MNKRYSMLVSISAVAVIAATLFGSVYTQSQLTVSTLDVSKTDKDMIKQIHDMGGLQLVMPNAYASVPLDQVDEMVAEGRRLVEFNVYGQSVELPIMGGGTYHAMTFNGQVPGPTLRVTQGDIVKVTLTVSDTEPTPHGIDLHAGELSSQNFGAVMPGESKSYAFIAEIPGTFYYHCSGVNVAAMDQHILSGMYGLTIVDPLDGYNKLMVEKTKVENGVVQKERTFLSADALEFQLQYNQLYITPEGAYDQSAMFQHHHAQTVVNGMALGYVPNENHNELIKGDKGKNIFVLQPWNSADLKQYASGKTESTRSIHR